VATTPPSLSYGDRDQEKPADRPRTTIASGAMIERFDYVNTNMTLCSASQEYQKERNA